MSWHSKKPDIENISKSCLDSLNQIVYKDDAQVALLMVTKIEARSDLLRIEITPLTP